MPAARARRLPKPGFLEMVDPTLVAAPRGADGWAHEVKWDGYRGQAHLEAGRCTMFSRNGYDWTTKFGPIAPAVAKLKARDAILDGEVVAIGSNGIADFQELRRQIGARSPRTVYQVFDLLWLDGEDLRPLPYVDRKARLKKLLTGARDPLAYVDWLEATGSKVLEGACRLHLEGVVSKRLDSPYHAGRSHDWLKTKCEVSETFAVVGFSRNKRGRIDGIYLGRPDDSGLRYAGQVVNGIGAEDMARLEQHLPATMVPQAPLVEVPKGKSGANWTRPELLVEVAYPNKSDDGRVRHPTFKGFRDDLLPKRRKPVQSRRRT